ncbi:hypothetical protein JL101_031120 (plasmid) [Skermanella rosea]|uniref:hypothetical protein n=1 Tax=Skermanella rosea TaxID=1817965 RepID=UPI001933125B|nr:hypothetical protein [Skermanella rosea]UEM06934.1 hypothetical protein JL101_031120 [Skermanella rosea]
MQIRKLRDAPADGTHRKVLVTTLWFGVLSGLCHGAVLLLAGSPGPDLTRMVWTSF